jgi:hypothetical protein
MPEENPHWDFLPIIDWFWVKIGVKGGLAMVLLKWIHPPGPGNVPTMAWTFAGRIRLAGRSEEGGTKLAALVHSLQTLINRGCQLVSGQPVLPEITEQILGPQFERGEI